MLTLATSVAGEEDPGASLDLAEAEAGSGRPRAERPKRRRVKLKPLAEQTLVITGASSGIGLVTARTAARRGARLMLASRNEGALRALCEELSAQGAQAAMAVADVGNFDDLKRVAELAVQRFGGFDTWVNNAGVGLYGFIDEVPLEDHRRLFETNFWGTVHGSLVALEHLQSRGGALINVGSQLSDHGVPLLGMYTASKHAVKGFTDSLRIELRRRGAPVSVTLIKPASVDSGFLQHARNRMDVQSRLPPPLYAPELVAQAILAAAERPIDEVFVGGSAKLASIAARAMPRWFHRTAGRLMYRLLRGGPRSAAAQVDNLQSAGDGLMERGSARGARVWQRSSYTRAALLTGNHSGWIVLGAAAAALAWWAWPARSSK